MHFSFFFFFLHGNGSTQWKDVGQLRLQIQPFSCVSPDWSVQGRVCCCEVAPPNPRAALHNPSSPTAHRRGDFPFPSKDVEEYCIASCATEVISWLQPNLNVAFTASQRHCVVMHSGIICSNKISLNHIFIIFQLCLLQNTFRGIKLSLVVTIVGWGLSNRAPLWLLPRLLNNTQSHFFFFLLW